MLQKLLKQARKGCKVIYIPGNHDEAGRQFIGMSFGRIKIREDAIHVTADGRRLWVTHGDMFDGVMQHARWLAYVGDWLYSAILVANRWFNRNLPQRGPLKPGEIETDQRDQKSMRKAISVPPQVPEVAEDGSAEQDEKNAESNRREQDGSMAQTGHCRTSGEARVICGLHRLRRINERVFQAPTSPNSTAAQFTDH